MLAHPISTSTIGEWTTNTTPMLLVSKKELCKCENDAASYRKDATGGTSPKSPHRYICWLDIKDTAFKWGIYCADYLRASLAWRMTVDTVGSIMSYEGTTNMLLNNVSPKSSQTLHSSRTVQYSSKIPVEQYTRMLHMILLEKELWCTLRIVQVTSLLLPCIQQN